MLCDRSQGWGTAIKGLASDKVGIIHELKIVRSVAASFKVTVGVDPATADFVLSTSDCNLVFFFNLFLCLQERNDEILDNDASVDHRTSRAHLLFCGLYSEKAENQVYAFCEAWIEREKHDCFFRSDVV